MHNNYIVSKVFRNFLLAAILSNVAEQLREVADGVIVGNCIDPDALSAMNMYEPMDELLSAVVRMFCLGAGFIAARRLAQHDMRGASVQFTLSLVASSVVVLLLAILSLLFFPTLIVVLAGSSSPVLADLTASYTRVILLGCLLQVPVQVLRLFISIDGRPQLVTRSIVLSLVLNVALDFLFISGLRMGIAGAAWASILSDVAGLLVLLPYQVSSACCFSLVRITHPKKELRLGIRDGLALASGDLIAGGVVLASNHLLLHFVGGTGVFIYAVLYQIIALCNMVNEGLGAINEAIGGAFLGEKDNSSFRTLVYKGGRVLTGILLAMCAVALICPGALFALYGADGAQATPMSLMALQIGGLLLVPYLLTAYLANVHTLVGNRKIALVSMVLQSVCIVVLPLAMALLRPSLVWWGYPLGALLALLVQMAMALVVHRRQRDTTAIALLPTLPDAVSMDYSLAYSDDAIDQSLKQAALFLNVCELPSEQRADLFICLNDIAYNIMTHSSDRSKEHFFDLRILDDTDTLDIWFKDAGKPNNPAHGLPCPAGVQLRHKYMFGLNVTTMHIEKKCR